MKKQQVCNLPRTHLSLLFVFIMFLLISLAELRKDVTNANELTSQTGVTIVCHLSIES